MLPSAGMLRMRTDFAMATPSFTHERSLSCQNVSSKTIEVVEDSQTGQRANLYPQLHNLSKYLIIF